MVMTGCEMKESIHAKRWIRRIGDRRRRSYVLKTMMACLEIWV